MSVKQKRDGRFRELLGRREEFQAIVRLLTEFDERTGRYRRFGDPQTHYMRKALCVCESDLLRVFFRDLGGYVYNVVVELQCSSGRVATGWIHEDGIRAERETFGQDSGHPVHNIVCLTDLFERDCGPPLPESGSLRADLSMSDALEELLNEAKPEVDPAAEAG